VGWKAVLALAKRNDLCVLTGSRVAEYIRRAQGEGLVPDNVEFHFVGSHMPWRRNRLIARIQSWLDYDKWMRQILPVAMELMATRRFDIVQHVTYVTWRVPSRLWRLDVPFIWGPVGGNETFPKAFLPMLSRAAQVFEIARHFSSLKARFSKEVKLCAQNAAHIFVSNRETLEVIEKLRGSREGISILSAVFFDEPSMARFGNAVSHRTEDEGLKLFAGGTLDGRKGVSVALHALAIVRERGVPFHYRVASTGSEVKHLVALSRKLDIGDYVTFGKGYRGREYVDKLASAHIYLLPSLRESAGITLMEAMLAGCVPIVADCGGPADIVASGTGFKVPVTTPAKMAEDIADVICGLHQKQDALKRMGAAARERIKTAYGEDTYLAQVEEVYQRCAHVSEE
jgi:glycosyltransferase involved in cell wall biosynthesis